MTILVTGATGYIGSRVVLQLAKRNLEIVAADLDMGKNKDKLEKKYIAAGHDLNLLKFEKLWPHGGKIYPNILVLKEE